MSQYIFAAGAKRTADVARKTLEKELGYDFFGLIIKLIVYFVVAWFLDGYIKAVAGQQNIVGKIIGIIGGIGGAFISAQIISYFTKPDEHKIPFWTVVKTVAIFMVFIEAKNYYELNESLNRKPSPFTLSIFGLIIALLGFVTFPDIMNKLNLTNLTGIGR